MAIARFLIAVAVIVSAGSAYAQSGYITVFADPGGQSCEVYDVSGPLTIYHVVHVLTPGATRSRFSIPLPPCHTGTYVADIPSFAATFGNSQTGVDVHYGQCLGVSIHVLEIWVNTFGTTPDCCCWRTLPDPGAPSGKIEVEDCSSFTYLVEPVGRWVNPVGCGGIHACNCLGGTVPIDESTWGRVKSLYVE